MRSGESVVRGSRPTILFIGPHPDDIELGCGGTIHRCVQESCRVVCVYLTKGERGGDPQARTREALNACECLGVSDENVHFGGFMDTRIMDSYDTISYLEQFVDENVLAACIPSEQETHQDHRNTSRAAITAFRGIPTLLAYQLPSTRPQFVPNAFVDITGHLRVKWKALRCHRSQRAKGKTIVEYRSMMRLASTHGISNGVRFAEAFEVIRAMVAPSALAGGANVPH